MEMIIMLAVIAALIALVYWKNVKNDVSVSAGQRPEEQEVTAKLDYFSEATGWHATFYNGRGFWPRGRTRPLWRVASCGRRGEAGRRSGVLFFARLKRGEVFSPLRFLKKRLKYLK